MAASTGPGWHYAEGDPPGTVRWWDGEMWTGEPVMQSPQSASAPGGAVNLTRYASWGDRLSARLLDGLIILALCIPILIVALILSAINETLGLTAIIFGYVAVTIVGIYLTWWAQGTHGQSPGKRIMGIETLHHQTGQFIGGGAGLGRAFSTSSMVCRCIWATSGHFGIRRTRRLPTRFSRPWSSRPPDPVACFRCSRKERALRN